MADSDPVLSEHRGKVLVLTLNRPEARNAVNAELHNGEDGIRGFTGSVAFPIPKTGAEVIWKSSDFYNLEGLAVREGTPRRLLLVGDNNTRKDVATDIVEITLTD